MSAPESNRLVWTAPAVSTLFNGLPMTRFEQYDELDMVMRITKASDGSMMTCAADTNCNVKYSWDWTPIMFHMVPAIVYPG